MEDLIGYLTARWDDEERVALAKRPTYDDGEDSATAEALFDAQMHTHACGYRMSCFDEDCRCDGPARVLDEIAAKRRILELHPYAGLLSAPESCDSCAAHPGPCTTLRLLALPYAKREDFKPEWRL